MAGEVTTAGCRAVARRAVPAERDAACLKGARDAGARIVGRTNLHELALGVTGVNPWYGTPVNPLDPSLVPGGSSSGSAVAVATGEAEVAYGSDTGGSVRIPAACCGVAGLKTTWGRIPLDGVWPLAPSFDTVGPDGARRRRPRHGHAAARAGLRAGRRGRGGRCQRGPPARRRRSGHHRGDRSRAAPGGWACDDLIVPGWDDALIQAGLLLVVEAWHSDGMLVAEDPEGIGDDVRARLELGGAFDDTIVQAAWVSPARVAGRRSSVCSSVSTS